MSVRHYRGPHAERGRGTSAWARRVPAVLAATTIGLQILWPLTAGQQRATVTVLVVWAFFLASATHAWLHRGWAWALGWAGLSLTFGLGVEVLGTRTGFPFSDYAYRADALGWTIAGIPVVIPLAWAMMSYPALLVGRRLAAARRGVVLIGAWALASWDLFLDPQMVGEGYWTWPDGGAYRGIPLGNYAGWLLTSAGVMLLLERVLPPRRASRAAVAQYAVVAAMQTVGFAAFFGDAVVAAAGGAAMLPVAAAAVVRVRRTVQ